MSVTEMSIASSTGDGSRAPLPDPEGARRILRRAAQGLDVDVEGLLHDFEAQLPARVSPREIQTILLQTVLQSVQFEPDAARLAARLLLRDLYLQAFGPDAVAAAEAEAPSSDFPSLAVYRHPDAHLARYVERACALGLLDAEKLRPFDLDRLQGAIAGDRDLLFRYNGLYTLADRYLVRDLGAGRILEAPQHFWMRVAMGIAWREDDPDGWAIRFYEKMSTLQYLAATPTLFNSAATLGQLSSCFVMQVEDELDHIGKSLWDVMRLEKHAGGIGLALTRLRAKGSPIASINGVSGGHVPFAKMFDGVVAGTSQGGRRRGSLALYLEPWHLEIEEFLGLRRRTGDEGQRVHHVNTALWLNAEFLRRVEADADWTLFDPRETPDLTELWGEAFDARYRRYEEEARAGRIRLHRTVRARDLFRAMLRSLAETSHPWLCFKDTANARSQVDGVIHSSNLCTEIFLPTDRDHVAVCNLASINLPRHLREEEAVPGAQGAPARSEGAADPDRAIDWERLADSVRTAVRQLDDVIEVNFYAIPEAERANRRQRPVGLGVMGLADLCERLRLPFDAPEAIGLADRLIEFISFHAIAASAELARERGSFPAFAESRWARGELPCDTWPQAPGGRPAATALDWEGLRRRVRRGMRNGTTMAIAPTATISMIAGTSQSIEPNYANLFARNNMAGKFLEVNENLVRELAARGLWEDLQEEILLARGDLQQVPGVPEDLKRVYRTAYQLDQRALVDMAAACQRWVDMGISRSLYFSSRDLDRLEEVYLHAWRQGLKSTYYAYFDAAPGEGKFLYRGEEGVACALDGAAGGALPDGAGGLCESCQ